MNHKRFIMLSILMLQIAVLFGQSISYTYDENGNRLTRILVVQRLQSNTVSFPVYNPKNLQATEFSKESSENTSDQTMQEDIKSENDKVVMVVYPNPNNGIIKIDISNMPLNSAGELKLYDLSGLELVSKRNIESHTEIDITRFKDGIYILRVKINEKIFDWKVIKNLTYKK